MSVASDGQKCVLYSIHAFSCITGFADSLILHARLSQGQYSAVEKYKDGESPVCTIVHAQHLAGIWAEPQGDMLPVAIMGPHLPDVDPVKELQAHTEYL